MATPITISSTCSTKNNYMQQSFTPKKYNTANLLVESPRSGIEFNNWDQRDALYASSPSSTTLSNIQKVSNWIRSIEGHDSGTESAINDLGIETSSEYQSFSKYDDGDAISSTDHNSESVIVVRCDFNDTGRTEKYFSRDSEMLIKYLRKADVKGPIEQPRTLAAKSNHKVRSNSIKKSLNDVFIKRPINSKHFCTKLERKFSSDTDDKKALTDTEIYDISNSPESRKKELCSYLQLMNPADKKEMFVLQNRRSTRVRNLTAIQEKKQQEKNVSPCEDQEIKLHGKQNKEISSMKAFRELNVKIEKCQFKIPAENKKLSEKTEGIFFPSPPRHPSKAFSDFNEVMSILGPKWKDELGLKVTKCSPKKSFDIALNKENVQLKIGNNIRDKDNKFKKTESETCIDKTSVRSSTNQKTQKWKIKKLHNLRRTNRKFRNTSKRNSGSTKTERFHKKQITSKVWKISKKKELRGSHEKTKIIIEPAKNSLSILDHSPKSINMSPTVIGNCEMETRKVSFENDHMDMGNFLDDMVDFDSLTEEHRKCLMQSGLFFEKPVNPYSSDIKPNSNSIETEGGKSECCGNNDTISVADCSVFQNDVNHVVRLGSTKSSKKSFKSSSCKFSCGDEKPRIPLLEHDYAGQVSKELLVDERVDDVECRSIPFENSSSEENISDFDARTIIKNSEFEILPYDKSVEIKSLHRSLQYNKKKHSNMESSLTQEWDPDGSPKQKTKKHSHYINIDVKEKGSVLKVFYIDYNLVICQELAISFWIQTPLGNVLGSQDMWIPRGQISRLALDNKYIQKESTEMIVCTEVTLAYIELWTKEHKSEIRERPVADVFVTLYFRKQLQNGIDKKVLQLENINGFADDVQYSVMKCFPKIIVCWHSANGNNVSKRTFIHAYQLATDYQTVSNIYNIQPVDHYVSSLHNIEDCENVIMGCGENKVTLWNVEFGYIIATIELSDIRSPLSTLWVKCDRGFLFAIQQCVDRELRLIAINGINHSWKKLASYYPPEGFDRLKGLCIENGLLLSFYDQGILCWKAETGELVEEVSIENVMIPCGRHVILVEGSQIIVKHAMTHLMSITVDDS